MSFDGSPPTKIIDAVVRHAFAVVEGSIYYVAAESGKNSLRFYDFANSRHATIADGIGDIGPMLAASRDGRRVLYSTVDAFVRDLMLVNDFR
jgi:hypothetical protein